MNPNNYATNGSPLLLRSITLLHSYATNCTKTTMGDPVTLSSGTPTNDDHVTAKQADELADQIKGLRDAAVSLGARTRRNEWAVALTVIGLVLDVALSIFAFVLLGNQSASNTRLEASIHEQCSLYGLIIPSYSETVKQKSPLGPTAYVNAYLQLQASSDHLSCGIKHSVPGT